MIYLISMICFVKILNGSHYGFKYFKLKEFCCWLLHVSMSCVSWGCSGGEWLRLTSRHVSRRASRWLGWDVTLLMLELLHSNIKRILHILHDTRHMIRQLAYFRMIHASNLVCRESTRWTKDVFPFCATCLEPLLD